MYLVAITRLATAIEVEAQALAAQLGGVAYEHRLKLNAGVPTILLATPDPEAARTCVSGLRARGHDAVVVNSANVVRADAMVQLKRFRFEESGSVGVPYRGESDALVTENGDRLHWAGITALVQAKHRTTSETAQKVTEKKFDLARATMTGGLLMNKTVTKTVTSRNTDHEAVLYLYGPSGTIPWLLREQHAHYEALGEAVTLSSLENFRLTVDAIRRRAPHALFDDGLVQRKSTPEEDDVLAHIIALASR